MWIPEIISDWVKPFTKKYYISLLFKLNSNYKAIQSRVETVFDSHQDEIKEILLKELDFIREKLPNSQHDINKLLDWELSNKIEEVNNKFMNDEYIWPIISRYILETEEFKKINKNVQINLISFRDTFDEQIWVYLKWSHIDIKRMEKEKKYAIEWLREWMINIKNLFLNQYKIFISDIKPVLITDSTFTEEQFQLLIDNCNKMISKTDNCALDNLMIILGKILDEMIWIITLK